MRFTVQNKLSAIYYSNQESLILKDNVRRMTTIRMYAFLEASSEIFLDTSYVAFQSELLKFLLES